MASKDEYYQRIIASLQADIKSQNSAISDLKTTVERQQKEIEALKASQVSPQQSSEPQQKWITTENLLLAVKRVCDAVILTHYEQLPTWLADRQEFEHFCKSSEQKFLSADTFTAYQKSLETRLKSIEEKLGRRFSIFTINTHNKKENCKSNEYYYLDTIRKIYKNIDPQWLLRVLIFSFICMFSFYLFKSITI